MAEQTAAPHSAPERQTRCATPVDGLAILAAMSSPRGEHHAYGELHLYCYPADRRLDMRVTLDLTPAQMRAVAATLTEQADYLDTLIAEAARLNAAPLNPDYRWPAASDLAPADEVTA